VVKQRQPKMSEADTAIIQKIGDMIRKIDGVRISDIRIQTNAKHPVYFTCLLRNFGSLKWHDIDNIIHVCGKALDTCTIDVIQNIVRLKLRKSIHAKKQDQKKSRKRMAHTETIQTKWKFSKSMSAYTTNLRRALDIIQSSVECQFHVSVEILDNGNAQCTCYVVDPISFFTLEKVMEDSDNVCDLELLFQKHAIVFEVKSEQALVLHTSKRRRYR
jgi:hypothetical protein